jgi:L-alanine-DL-glutamate epimerase-like enolase superfamily enzyme
MTSHKMIIKDVRVTLLRMPWVDPPRWSLAARDRELVVVEVETASGIVGLGYLMPLNGGLQTIAACLRELFIPRLIGKDATQIEAIWKDLWRSSLELGRMGIAILGLSAIDIALWDALGKLTGLPLYRLWGGFKKECPAYGSGCWRGLGCDGMIEKAKTYINMGFSCIKMQCGHLYDELTDVAHVKNMREALGANIGIMIDVNMAWTSDQAISVGKKIEKYDVYWIEEPVLPDNFRGYFEVADKLSIRIVGGENHFTRYDLRPFLENPRISILQPDVMRGGLTEIRKISALADTWGMTIAPHLFHELMVHVVASIPNGHQLEYVNFLDDIWVDPVLPKKGIVTVPERPGHGLSIKGEVLRDFAVGG